MASCSNACLYPSSDEKRVTEDLHEERHVERFSSLISSHLESLLPVLVGEYEKSLSLLQADNRRLHEKLLFFERGHPTQAVSSKMGGSSSLGNTYVSLDDYATFATHKEVADDAGAKETDQLANTLPVSNDAAHGHNGVPALAPSAVQLETLKEDQEVAETTDVNVKPSREKKIITTERVLWLESRGDHDHDDHPVHEERDVEASFPFPEHQWSFLQRIVFSNTFECISGLVIMLNTFAMAMQLQYDGFTNGHNILGPRFYSTAKETWPGADKMFLALDWIFNVVFIIELIFRLAAARLKALKSGWIWFDAIVITLSVVELLSSGGGFIDPGMMRVVRLVRLVRLLKVFHAMSGFDSLFLLIKAVQASFIAAIWSFLILLLIQIIMGLFLCQYLRDYLEDELMPIQGREVIFKYFGTFSRAMFTMFEITFGGWHVSCRHLMDNVGEWFSLFFVIYRCMFLFAVLKVIAAVFITETNRVLEHDDELNLIKANRELQVFKKKFQSLVAKIDSNKDGTLNWEELGKLMKDESLTRLLPMIGFDKNDLLKLFWLIDDDQGEVPVDDFFTKLCKLKGPSKKINEMATLKLVYKIHQRLESVWEAQGLAQQERREFEAETSAVLI